MWSKFLSIKLKVYPTHKMWSKLYNVTPALGEGGSHDVDIILGGVVTK